MLPNSATYSDYGGEKQDYSAPEDPTTDRSAAEMNEAFLDTAAMTRTISRAWFTFTVSGGVCTVTDHDAVWGNDLSVKPAVVYQIPGRYLVSIPPSVVDARGVSRTPNLKCGGANAEDSAYVYHGSVRFLNSLSIHVFAWNLDTGSLDDPDGNICVWVM